MIYRFIKQVMICLWKYLNYTAKGIKLYNMNSHDLQVVDKIKQGNSGL